MAGEDDEEEDIEDAVASPVVPTSNVLAAVAAAGTTVAPDKVEHFFFVFVGAAAAEVVSKKVPDGAIEVSISRFPVGRVANAVRELVGANRTGACVREPVTTLRRAEGVGKSSKSVDDPCVKDSSLFDSEDPSLSLWFGFARCFPPFKVLCVGVGVTWLCGLSF